MESAARSFDATYAFAVESGWLTMPDGVRLAVDFYRPVARTPDEKFPVVLEAVPYRKDDSFALRDYPIYAYLARRGIAGARVDVRGTGASEGHLPDREYSDAELADLETIVAQLAALPWSNGNVGMQGISWSAFNAIMTAMRRPPALRAILVAHGSHDLYANDLHAIDGLLHVDIFEVEMATESIVPRPPAYSLDQDFFRDRFDTEPWTLIYLRHQRDGAFWRSGRSLFTAYDAIEVPVYAIGGLLDGYRDVVPHLLANVASPMKGELGPWSHDWPDTGVPGPNHEWRQTAVRWWQQWLNGVETGVMTEPRFTVFMRGTVPPDVGLSQTPGAFWSEDWPVASAVPTRSWPQMDGTLTRTPAPPGTQRLTYRADTGAGLLNWWGETTGDVGAAAADALVYDSQPLSETLYLLGIPEARLTVSADAPLAHWVTRLEDVWPDGQVSLVTGGAVNAAQRHSRTRPEAIVPGEAFVLEIPLRFTTWTFLPGHCIRLVVANGQFGMFWPTPYPMTTTLHLGDTASALVLPLVSPTTSPPPPRRPPEPREERPDARLLAASDDQETANLDLTPYRVERDPATGHTTLTAGESSAWAVAGREYRAWNRVTHRVRPDDPAHVSFLGEGFYEIRLPSRTVTARATIRIDSDARDFLVWITRRIAENGAVVREREWRETIPRDGQ